MPSRLCSRLSRVLLLALILFAGPAFAQQADGDGTANASGDGPAYSTLADLLENEQSRSQLIQQLRQMAENAPEQAQAAGGAAIDTAADATLPKQLADMTSRVVTEFGFQFENLVNIFGAMVNGAFSEGELNYELFTEAAINLGLVILATFVMFVVIRRLVRPLFTRLSQYSQNGQTLNPTIRLVLCVVLAVIVDAAVVGLAYVGGNLAATFAIGETGSLSTRASLFLNAFLVIELLKAAVRMLFASRYEGLRLLPISADNASYWNRWIARLIGLTGYGLMVVVPLINTYLSYSVGEGIGALIMIGAYLYAITVVLINRTKLRDALFDSAVRSSLAASGVALRMLGRTWHLWAIIYFSVVLVLTLTRPEDALPFVLMATLKTLGIVLAAMLISRLLVQAVGRRITLSSELNKKLPLLETRLNSYVPTLLRIVNVLILIVAAMALLNAWGVFDMATWYASEAGRLLVSQVINVVIILVVAAGTWIALASFIEHKLNPSTGRGMPSARAQTLLSLFRNALAIAIVTMTAMIVLSEIGINIGPLIAGAGVLGLAIGFGAQKLVQDIITGIFIQVENAMNTGDVVTLGGITGTAEKLSIRSVGIRDLHGTYHLVPFSSVDVVSNYMRGFAYHVGEYGVAYRENVDEAIVALRNAFDELSSDDQWKTEILEPLEVAGVIALADSSVNIRVRIKTTPGNQWAIGRAYNRLVKMHLDEAGIEIPFPHTTVYFGEDKQGKAPAANLRLVEKDVVSTGKEKDTAPLPGEEGSVDAPREHETREYAETNAKFRGDYDPEGN
ncbi:mechanosensitive channel protein [Halomonas sp. DP5Y7-2]|uniref:mechanosensitive channel protein n=1 Tax=Halomonas sp. DP5Y7-2 TaxID=2859076 RepID=UPI001C995940|nr:mechanosensitive channel protein [Halomonas sp. DP5Y7-2]MBY5983664.1 mechanosensitive channel protein [Halomonas sp. DP5Y7-2]